MLLLATVAFGVPLALSLSTRIHDEVKTQAHDQAALVGAEAADLLGGAQRAELRALADAASISVRGRVLIVNAAGRVLVDSAGPAEVGSSYANRPELRRALAGTPDQVERYSRTLHQAILATAVPVVHDGHTAGAVRVTQSVGSVNSAVTRVELELIAIGLVVLLIGLLGGSVLANQISRPLRRLEQVARRVAQGELTARAAVEGSLEQRSLARSFNEMADRIGRLLSAQKDFVADASHQLRTPLTGLRLRLEEARASLAGDHPSTRELDRAMAEVDRLAETVSELLLLSRAGERSIAGTNVDLGDVVAAAAQRWTAEAAKREITLTAEAAEQPGRVWIAREDIDRALDALVENAVHYSPAGSAVTLVAAAARIEVRDRGRGIALAERAIVFERFRRGSAGRTGPSGHGLGLPIARELARAWGGEVTLEPRLGGGTCARLDLSGAGRDPASADSDPRRFAGA
ncbi:MAG: HAMP domain-containing protein [Acidobacteriota bacterium]|nr:HAMP domain-containing protein [Acidobacteriota bacterium]